MTTTIAHLTMEELDAGLDHIRQAPKDQGVLELIVRRPVSEQREVLTVGQLAPAAGLADAGEALRAAFDLAAAAQASGARGLVPQPALRAAFPGGSAIVADPTSAERLTNCLSLSRRK